MTNTFMPVIRRKIIEPFWVLKNGSPLISHWRRLEESQYQSEKKLKEEQFRRLKEIIQFAYQYNAFYKRKFDQVGIDPKSLDSPDDMTKFPIITKEDIRNNYHEIISEGFGKKDLLNFKTGGSTGKSLDIFITEECSELRNACARRHDRWSGWEVGESVGALWGNPPKLASMKKRLRNYLLSPHVYLDTMEITEKAISKFKREWMRVKGTLLFGHAHSLYLLARYALDNGNDFIHPKAVISSCMMLLKKEREVIEEAFGARVFDRYGCEEVSLIASECERHEGMHLNIDHLFIEFVKEDGSYAKVGEEASIVVTDLINKAMPFIRYRVEDMGIPTDRKCSCGRGLPLMEKVTGRVADFLAKKDGTKVAGISLIENTLTKIPGIVQMQIIQEEIDRIILNLVPDDHFQELEEKNLVEYFVKLFGKETVVEIRRLSEIKAESGKYRFSICNVKK